MSGGGPALDRAIARIAAPQHGVITLAQLLEAGLSRVAIDHRVRAGRLHRLHRGIYAVGRPDLKPDGHRLAAVLACGPDALLSHKSAGALWEILATAQTRIDVTVPGRSPAPRPGIRVHRTRSLHPEDLRVLNRIPVTSLARTIADLAAVLNPAQLLRAIEQATRLERLDFTALERTIQRSATRTGTKVLRAILADFTAAPRTRSELERDFLELVTAHRLPPPRLNVQVAGFEVDAFWPQWQLVVELDGRAYHSPSGAFEGDRVRDAGLQRAGHRVLRVTHKRLHREPAQVLADVRALAALGSPAGARRGPR